MRLARDFVADATTDCRADAVHAAVLLTSELATNSVQHATSAFTLAVARSDRSVWVGVTDSGPGVPTPRDPEPHEDSGRGLLILSALARSWGVDHPEGGGKRVWFELDC